MDNNRANEAGGSYASRRATGGESPVDNYKQASPEEQGTDAYEPRHRARKVGTTMARFKTISRIINATQWFKNGDHPEDKCETLTATGKTEEITGMKAGEQFLSEGKVVRYYRHPRVDGFDVCKNCGQTMHNHGWIDTRQGGHTVCPGDWIITAHDGE
jgi:hypothetical protein